MVLPQLSARQANRQTGGTSMHLAQRIMVNKDKYPYTMGCNPTEGIFVVKCHMHPSLLHIKDIRQLNSSLHPLLHAPVAQLFPLPPSFLHLSIYCSTE